MHGGLVWFLLAAFCTVNGEKSENAHPKRSLAGSALEHGYAAPTSALPYASTTFAPHLIGAGYSAGYAGILQSTLAPFPSAAPISLGHENYGFAAAAPLPVGGSLGAYSPGLFEPLPTGAGLYSAGDLAPAYAPFEAGIYAEPPIVHKHFYHHTAPADHSVITKVKHINIGRPQKNYKVIFINNPQTSETNAKISVDVAPQEEKTVVYVLSQNSHHVNVEGIAHEPPAIHNKPEVYFIKYKTPEEALHAQQQIRAQYDALGGTSQASDEGVAPITSVIGSLGHGPAIAVPAPSIAPTLAAIPLGHAQNIQILGHQHLSSAASFGYAPTTFAPPLTSFHHSATTIAPLPSSAFAHTTLAPNLGLASSTIAPTLSAYDHPEPSIAPTLPTITSIAPSISTTLSSFEHSSPALPTEFSQFASTNLVSALPSIDPTASSFSSTLPSIESELPISSSAEPSAVFSASSSAPALSPIESIGPLSELSSASEAPAIAASTPDYEPSSTAASLGADFSSAAPTISISAPGQSTSTFAPALSEIAHSQRPFPSSFSAHRPGSSFASGFKKTGSSALFSTVAPKFPRGSYKHGSLIGGRKSFLQRKKKA